MKTMHHTDPPAVTAPDDVGPETVADQPRRREPVWRVVGRSVAGRRARSSALRGRLTTRESVAR